MEKYPYLHFVTEDLNISDKKINANLTIKNTTKPMILTVDFSEITTGKDSGEKVKLLFFEKIHRRNFGLTWDGKNGA